jgi:hypothetical protein
VTSAQLAVPPQGAVSACRGLFMLTLAAAPSWAVTEMDLVYLSTRYYLDPAVASLPDADTELLFVRGIAYAGAEDTSGFVPEAIVPSLIRRRRYGAAVEALVARSLWLPASGDRGQPGYRIARWQEWQEELEALERRRAADRERKRRERAREAAESAEPPRKRGRPRIKPQVKNVSRDMSAISSADSPNNARSRSRSLDLDLDQSSAVSQFSRSGVSDARPRESGPLPGSPEFRVQVVAEMAGRGFDIDDATADALAAEVLGRAVDPVPKPLGYVRRAIVTEPNPRARWLPKRQLKSTGKAVRLPWCGKCDEIDRTRENDQGKLQRCPECSGRAPAWEAS